MHAYVFKCGVCTHVSVCAEAGGEHLHIIPLKQAAGSPPNLELTTFQLGWCPVGPSDTSVSLTCSIRLAGAMSNFFVGAKDLNSGRSSMLVQQTCSYPLSHSPSIFHKGLKHIAI